MPRRAGRFAGRRFGFALAGYLMFGLGYIGYMTFIVTLLREQGMGSGGITAFYALLGAGVVASSWLWAGLLQRHRGGVPMALLNALLALATVLPVLSASLVAVFASGVLFGCVFLSVVASTTALVRHNLPTRGLAGRHRRLHDRLRRRPDRRTRAWSAGWPTVPAGCARASRARLLRWRSGALLACAAEAAGASESQRGARKTSMRASSASSAAR